MLSAGFDANKDDAVSLSSTIRNAFSVEREPMTEDETIFAAATFTDFKIGHMIGQGCNSAVYEARFSKSEFQNMQRQYSFATDEADDVIDSEGSFEVIMESDDDIEIISEESISSLGEDNTICTSIADLEPQEEPLPLDTSEFNLAIKMMFNYDLESNADAIFRGMMKEITPMKFPPHLEKESMWLARNRVKLKLLPPHPNIVCMQGIFVDDVPKIENDEQRYPAALPNRLNPDNGLGRNKTLFLVMKKYDVTLKSFLSQNNVNLNTRCSLLAQLLEGILHMTENEIAHRDLKSDNILVDTSTGRPQLVISDFGCCLAEADYGLVIPYNTSNIDKGGNAALMPPEIAMAEHGRNMWLDYRKSDIWSAGTLVYEIFGEENPFYKGPMDSSTYDEKDLPPLPDAVPKPIRKLTKLLLKRDPTARPTAQVAANIAQMCILFPEWLNHNEPPSMEMIRESVVLLSAAHILKQDVKRNQLTTVFLQRVEIASLLKSLEWYMYYINC
jgi:serine/threonine protein kinase